jgi:predicted nucleic-acid-binding Zn-ribbon protein
MSATRKCPRCDGRRFWQVAMREQQGTGEPVALAVAYTTRTVERKLSTLVGAETVTETAYEGHGRFETLVCRGCGYTSWYARDAGGAPVTPETHACTDCGKSAALRVREVKERDHEGALVAMRVLHKGFPKYEAHGAFDVVFCGACGRAQWYALGVDGIQSSSFFGVRSAESARRCAGCSGDKLWHIATARERGDHGAVPIAVAIEPGLLGYRATGKFELVVCRACGLTDWYAHDIERLAADPSRGVTEVTA